MLSYSKAFYEAKNKLQPLYDEREAASIGHELLFYLTLLDKAQRLINKDKQFNGPQQAQYELMLVKLLKGQPLQYVTGLSWFMGQKFKVNEHVLIPRPETEELVQWVIDDHKNSVDKLNVIDIGTGSGCIPVSLKLAFTSATVTACDISKDALALAKINASLLDAIISFIKTDFLSPASEILSGEYDIIISNPPYIPFSERSTLHANVRDYEPAIALFVPDDDALVFYKAIATFGKTNLREKGSIYCELDAAHAAACKILFEAEGYKYVEIRKDMSGNWRMLKASFVNKEIN